MNDITKKRMADAIKDFHMPRYAEIPNVGFYLDQTVQYINQCLEPLRGQQVTASMISNYVKQGDYVKPVKKQYYAEQIMHLLVIMIMKNILSLENIHKLFHMQKGVYTDQVAYDYFCSELENILKYVFGARDVIEDVGTTVSDEKMMLRDAIISVSHMIYLNWCFEVIDAEQG
jgi:hypothetical protein